MITTTPTLTLRPLDMERDLEALVRMWQESDDQWPGTVSDGVPITVDWVRGFLQREKFREVSVWQADDDIAGYCSLWDYIEEPGVVYIATLNVAPRFQKLSLGRRFLTYFVGRAAEMGAPRLDLHTWPGNLKAVPLYKKCGFFWLPGPHVHLINLLPTILRMPAAQAFFAAHDWYASFQRELTQKEDDECWEGMRVFTYRFVAGDDALTVWGHRHSRAVTAIENQDLFAAAIVADETPARGMKTPIRWKVTNKRAEPVEATLIASGTSDLQLDQRATLRLAPGETAEIHGEVAVAATLADIQPDRVAPAVRSILIIGGTTIELNTGLRPRAPVEAGVHPEHITLTPGTTRTVELQLRSRLSATVKATLVAAAPSGLEADWTVHQVVLPAGEFAAVPMTLRAATPGVYELPLSIRFELDGQLVNLPQTLLAVFALPLGGVLGAKVGDRLRLENEHLRMIIESRGAETKLYDPASAMELGGLSGYAVPPGAPSEYWDALFDLSIAQEHGQVIAIASVASKEHPGFMLRRRIALGASPALTMTHEFDNRGALPLRFKLHQRLDTNGWRAERVLPLDTGLARGPVESFPGVQLEAMKKPESYAEGWAAVEGPLGTVGMLFPADMERLEFGWDGMLSRYYEIAPGARVTPDPLIVYAGPGGWQAVRRLWQRYSGMTLERADQMPQPAEAILVRAEPSVTLALAGESRDITLLVEHAQARAISGTIMLEMPQQWRASITSAAFDNVSRGAPFRAVTTVTAPEAPQPASATLRLRSPDLDRDSELPLLCVGRQGEVRISTEESSGQQVHTVDNGRLSYTIAPGFAASLSSLQADGVEWLRSPFPRAATFSWMSPWFGGLTPVLHVHGAQRFPGTLWQERFSAAEVETVQHDLPWRGIRQRATLQDDDVRGLDVELDTLTLCDSPLVRLVFRVLNRTPVWRRIDALGWFGYIQPGGDAGARTLWSDRQQIKHNDRGEWHSVGQWVAAESVATGRTLLLCSPQPAARAVGWGVENGHMALIEQAQVAPMNSYELEAWLVIAADIDEARRWTELVQ